MTTTTLEGHGEPGHGHAHDVDFYREKRGLASWLFTLDHKRIGIMYMVGTLLAFMAGGVLAILFRADLLTPESDFGRATHNTLFTLHGALMVFIFIIPAIPGALGNFFLPLMLGAKDVAFPRLNLLSFYLWCTGTLILLFAILAGGLDTGWTFYTPFSTVSSSTNVISAALGIFITGFSSILTGLNFIVTIHRMRAPGMTWFRLPLFIWSHYATSLIMVLGTPVIAITILLVAAERLFRFGFFATGFFAAGLRRFFRRTGFGLDGRTGSAAEGGGTAGISSWLTAPLSNCGR